VGVLVLAALNLGLAFGYFGQAFEFETNQMPFLHLAVLLVVEAGALAIAIRCVIAGGRPNLVPRRWQFSLWNMLIAFFVVACVCFYFRSRIFANHESSVAATIRRVHYATHPGRTTFVKRSPTYAELSAITAAPTLHQLSLDAAELDDEMIRIIHSHRELRELELIGCDLPPSQIHKLRPLNNLRRLSLRDTTVNDQGLSVISAFGQLEHLSLTGARLTGQGLSHLSRLAALRELNLCTSLTSADGLQQLETLPALTELHLDRIAISSWPKLRLTYLRVRNATLSGDALAGICAMDTLQILQLDDTNVTDQDLARILSLPKLDRLILAGTRVTDSGFANAEPPPQLAHISLDRTGIGDATVITVCGWPGIRTLSLSWTKVTDNVVGPILALSDRVAEKDPEHDPILVTLHNTRVSATGVGQLRQRSIRVEY
jgi:hypothetical protein